MHMWNFFKVNGGAIVKDYVGALLDVPGKDVAETFCETIGVLCVTFMEEDKFVP